MESKHCGMDKLVNLAHLNGSTIYDIKYCDIDQYAKMGYKVLQIYCPNCLLIFEESD